MEVRHMRREYTYEDYIKAVDMYKRGIGPTEISRKTGVKKRTVRAWIYEGKIPWLARWHPEPSNELAYILGVLYGDGYTVKEHNYTYDIELLVKDYEFAEVFSRNMSKLLNKKYMKSEWSKSHNRWRVYYRSKAFHQWYKKRSLESLKQYIEYSKENIANFLKVNPQRIFLNILL
jgi:intein-encoded DNA endonuclease-like protein